MQFLKKVLCYLLITTAVISISGCHKPDFDEKIDWNLHGVWVTADGIVQTGQEGVDFTLSGTLPTEFEPYSPVEMELDFVWPDTLGYQNKGLQTYTGGASLADKHSNQPVYHGAGWLYHLTGNTSVSLGFTVYPDKEFAIVHIGDRYLVASTDPNADPAEIFAFYKEYVNVSQ